jgi:hypothetical protein
MIINRAQDIVLSLISSILPVFSFKLCEPIYMICPTKISGAFRVNFGVHLPFPKGNVEGRKSDSKNLSYILSNSRRDLFG